jgi:hypothetical protein
MGHYSAEGIAAAIGVKQLIIKMKQRICISIVIISAQSAILRETDFQCDVFQNDLWCEFKIKRLVFGNIKPHT